MNKVGMIRPSAERRYNVREAFPAAKELRGGSRCAFLCCPDTLRGQMPPAFRDTPPRLPPARFFNNLLDAVAADGPELLFEAVSKRFAELLQRIGGAAGPAAQVDATSEPVSLEGAFTLQTLGRGYCHRVLA
jgi:hypothetical protein